MDGSMILVEESQKRHNFDLKKNNIKKFSETVPKYIEIDRVQAESGLWGIFDHKVTGDELNYRIQAIQSYLIKFNNEMVRVIEEFKEVYEVIDLLDNDYIHDIVANMNALNKTNNDIRKQQTQLEGHTKKLKSHQNDLDNKQVKIEKALADNEKTMSVIRIFHQKLKKLDHLPDIDSIWNDCVVLRDNCKGLRDDIIKNAQKLEEWEEYYKEICSEMITSEEVDEYIEKINADILEVDEKYREKTEEVLKHTEEKTKELQENMADTRKTLIGELESNVKKINEDILQVDEKYCEKTRELKNQIDQQDTELQNKIEDTKQQLLSDMNQTKDSIEQEMQIHVEKADKLEHKVDDEITELKGKIKILYYALGGTAGLFVMETILNVMGVI